MSSINLEDLMSLTAGDIVEVPSLAGALTQEATIFQVELATEQAVNFRVMFHGIRIANATLFRDKGGLSWTYK